MARDGMAKSQGRREGPRGPCSPSRDSNTGCPQTMSESVTQGTRGPYLLSGEALLWGRGIQKPYEHRRG